MPIIKSAKKALRQTRRRTVRRTSEKNDLEALLKKADATNLSMVISKIDKATKHKLFSKQKAARIKSRLFKKIKPMLLKPRITANSLTKKTKTPTRKTKIKKSKAKK